jgi:cytochrome o ubiquinol oxidase subunit 3
MNATVTSVHSVSEAKKRIAVGYGFWIFLLSDIVMFSCFFASYAVLVNATAGGQEGRQLFDLDRVAIETACLLGSSFTCGLAFIASGKRSAISFHVSMAATLALGAAFLILEGAEFSSMLQRNAGPTHSAFLSAFFSLVGCHGIHVSIGLLWLMTMMAQVYAKGFRDDILRRILCFTLFWHALDIIWVALFTVVYLIGVAP